MEAVDYGQRLLCVQREREFVITAHFHCNGNEKIIRWVRVDVGNDGRFRAKVSRPASLAPGGDGQWQLLTLLMMSSEDIGLRLPSVQPFDHFAAFEIHSWLGRGATSRVYRACWNGKTGVVKILEPFFIGCVDREVNVLAKLIAVPGVPRGRKIATNAILFDRVLSPMGRYTASSVQQLVTCLKQSHDEGVVHRDVRPENVMCIANETILNDWGCAAAIGTPVAFAGTFRYASNEVLVVAGTNAPRAPQAKDDLHSLIRTVLAMTDVEIREKLSSIDDRDYGAVSSFWEDWRKRQYTSPFLLPPRT